MSDIQLKSLSSDLQLKAQRDTSAESMLVEAFALVKEACIRQLGLCPYDVQILAGLGLASGDLIEMQTGEGKTLAATFPAYLHALGGRKVHILTFNDYLARRDAAWMGPVFKFLGLKVDHCSEGMSLPRKRRAYEADVTYTTAKTIGFDYLRSFLAYHPEEILLPDLHYGHS